MFFSRYIKSHHISRAALIAGGLGAAILFFAMGAALRLLFGPVSLGPLGDALPNAIAQALPGITVRYDQAAIEWSRDQGRVNLVILGARVFDSEGRIIAQAPQADIDLAARPLLQGRAVVRRITLVGVQLTLVRTLDGGLRMGVEKDKDQHDFLSRLSDAITMNSDKASSLQAFAVRHARVAFFDEPTKLFVVAPDANFRITTSGANLVASLDTAIEMSGRAAKVTGEFTIPPHKGPVSGTVAIRGIDLRALAQDSKAFAGLKRLALVVDVSASFSMRGTHLLSADFGLGANGTVAVPGLLHGPLKVRAFDVLARYDGASNRLLVDDATLDAGGTSAHGSGRIDFVRDPSGKLIRAGFDAALDKVALEMPGVLGAPVSLRAAAMRGSYDPIARSLTLEHVQLDGGAFSAQAAGRVVLDANQAPAIDVQGQLAALSVRDLLHYWPLGIGEGARDWIDRNMPAGRLGPVPFEMHMAAGEIDAAVLPDSALKLTIPVAGAEVNYIGGLTHMTQVQGTATLTGDTFSADIASGRIGALAVSRGHAVIANLHVPAAPGQFAAHVAGSMPDLLALIDLKPLNYPTRFGISKTQTKGAANLDLYFQLPMRKDLSVDDVGISIKATVRGFSIALGEHARLSDGSVDFLIDNAKLHADGTAMLVDSKLAFGWDEDFRTADPITTRVVVKGTLDDGGRAALNFPSAAFLKGPTPVNATVTGHRGSLRSADMALDLTPATLNLDLIGLDKPAGFLANARVSATFGASGAVQGEALKLGGPGIAANGSAAFDKDGHLTSLSFPNIHFGSANDFSVTLNKTGGGNEFSIRGHSLDGSHLGGQGAGGDMTLTGPFHVDARLDRLMLRNGVSVSPFTLDVSGVSDRPSALALSGSLSKSATITGAMSASDAGRRLTFTTNDAGLLAKGLFGLASLKAGKLEFSALLPGKPGDAPDVPDYQGTLTLKDFKVLNQPFLTRLFSAGSLDGLINLMQGEGIAVDKLDVPFSSRNGVIDVHDARATGPAIGLTADGYIDRPKNDVALKGSLVPLFMLNSILGAIPLVGNVLVSKPGEGIFGMTYAVSGNADRPEVSVNPLAVLTPGILRRVFEGKMPTSAQAPSNAPAAPPAVIKPKLPN